MAPVVLADAAAAVIIKSQLFVVVVCHVQTSYRLMCVCLCLYIQSELINFQV